MIEGFTKETSPLTNEELKMVDPLVRSFNTRTGVGNAITSTEIIAKCKKAGMEITGPRLRKLVHHIRVNDLVELLISTSKGYYVEKRPEKVKDYVKGLRQRAEAIEKVAKAIERQHKKRAQGL